LRVRIIRSCCWRTRLTSRQWLTQDPGRLGASLEQFAGHPAYGITQLREDLERFAFLLGGSDGEPLFSPQPE
jgi:hypothetical protein